MLSKRLISLAFFRRHSLFKFYDSKVLTGPNLLAFHKFDLLPALVSSGPSLQLDDHMNVALKKVFYIVILHIFLNSYFNLLLSRHLPKVTGLRPLILCRLLVSEQIVLLSEPSRLGVLLVVRLLFRLHFRGVIRG